MTIVAYVPSTDTIYVDSLYTYGNGRRSETATKIETQDGITFALAGSTVTSAAIKNDVIRLLKKGGGRGTEKYDDMSDFEGLARTPDRKVWYVSSTADGRVVVSPAWKTDLIACGSGGDWAYAYLASAIESGHSPEEAAVDAVEQTVALHEFCGPPIETF